MKTNHSMKLAAVLGLLWITLFQGLIALAQDLQTIEMRNGNVFFPTNITVRDGERIRWRNVSSSGHTVTHADGAQTDIIPLLGRMTAGTPAPEQIVTITEAMFNGRTQLNYLCTFHPTTMRAQLTLSGTGPIVPPSVDPPATAGVTINIEGRGADAKLIEAGKTEQAPVRVNVGQTLRWVNNTPEQHVLDGRVGDLQFHLVVPIKEGSTGGFIDKTFTAEEFQRAGGSGTNTVQLSYISQTFGDRVGSQLQIVGVPSNPEPPSEHPTTPATPSGADPGLPPSVGAPLASFAIFEDAVIDGTVTNSYYILPADMNNDGFMDVVTSGLGAPDRLAVLMRQNPNATDAEKAPFRGTVAWYQNPGVAKGQWARRVIAQLDVPVPVDAADIDGDGLRDVAVSWNYGLCIFNCQPGNGITSWFRNPGVSTAPWTQYPIGNLLANHRLFFGHYTQTKRLELMALPVVGGHGGEGGGALKRPIHTTIFKQPDDPLTAKEWEATVANDKYTLIHDASIHKFGAVNGSDLDSAIVAGGEGISWLYADEAGKWQSMPIGVGEQSQANPNGFNGSGGVTACRFGSDPFSYLATQEPLHGNVLAVYTKNIDGRMNGISWKRTVLDTFGPFTASGEGPMHHVIALDVDGDGNDEFLVALRGPLPYQGVYLYKAVDPAQGKFVRQRVSFISAARIAVADFDGDGRVDFATAPYDVSTYFDAGEPNILVFYNRTPQVPKKTAAGCTDCASEKGGK